MIIGLLTPRDRHAGRLGLLAFACLATVFVCSELWFDRFSLLTIPDLQTTLLRHMRLAVVQLVLVCYLPVACWWVVRGSRQMMNRLKYNLALPPREFAALRDSIGAYGHQALLAGCILANSLLVMLIVALTRDYVWSSHNLTVEARWQLMLSPFIATFLYILIHAYAVESARLNLLARRLGDLGSPDDGCVKEFDDIALQNAKLILVAAGICSLLLLDWEFLAAIYWLTAIGVAIGAYQAPLRAISVVARREHGVLRRLLVSRFTGCLLIPAGFWVTGKFIENVIENTLA